MNADEVVEKEWNIKLTWAECPYRFNDELTPPDVMWCRCQDGNPACRKENCPIKTPNPS